MTNYSFVLCKLTLRLYNSYLIIFVNIKYEFLLDLNQATDVLYCDDQDDDNKPIQEFVQVSAFGAQEANAEDAFATNSLPFNFCDPYDIEDLQV